jgi:hypothetical protein
MVFQHLAHVTSVGEHARLFVGTESEGLFAFTSSAQSFVRYDATTVPFR